jgi:hypothetical protein
MNTVIGRVEHEGLSFLTITLPSFARDFEKCLDMGRIDPTLFQGFRRSGSLPAFLQGLTGQVFDRGTGDLLDDPSSEALQAVRQVCYLFKKLELGCSAPRVEAAFRKYIECDKEVGSAALRLSRTDSLRNFRRMAELLYVELFTIVDSKVANCEIVPRHGPGATQDRTIGNAKYDYCVWTTRLEKVFHAGDFLYPSWSHFVEDETGPIYLEPGEEPPVRVVQVPKTLKAPRIIAIEPVHMQYVQ